MGPARMIAESLTPKPGIREHIRGRKADINQTIPDSLYTLNPNLRHRLPASIALTSTRLEMLLQRSRYFLLRTHRQDGHAPTRFPLGAPQSSAAPMAADEQMFGAE